MYTEKVMHHFRNPKNVGRITSPDGVGVVGSEDCGDLLEISIKVDGQEVIEDVKFLVRGCAAAIASSSMTTVLAKGLHIYDALNINEYVIADALGGLPEEKFHCSVLGAEALRKAIKNYLDTKYFDKQ